MKKYLSAVFVLSLLLAGVVMSKDVSAQTVDVGCLPGYKYSNTTGKPCFGVVSSQVCTVITKNLKVKQRGSEVVMLQQFLYAHGYYDEFDVNNPAGYGVGLFNEATQTGVMDFQEDYGMTRDGFVGPETRNQIRALSCVVSHPSIFGVTVTKDVSSTGLITVKWSTNSSVPSPVNKNSPKNLRLQIHSMDKGANSVFGLNTINDGEESMYLPSNMLLSNYKAVLYHIGTPNWYKYGVSEVFQGGDTTDPNPSVTVLSPNGGETYKAGDQMTVRWETNNLSSNKKVVIVLDSAPENTMDGYNMSGSEGTQNDGSEVFTLSSNLNGKFKVRILVLGSEELKDSSDEYFNITSGNVPANHTPQMTLTEVPLGITVGKAVTFNLSATDEDGDNISWVVNWDNGTSYASEGKDTNGKNILCPATKQSRSVTPSVTWGQAGTHRVNIDLRDCKGGFLRSSVDVVVGNYSAYLNLPTLNTEISTPARNIAVPTSGLTDGSRASYNFTSTSGPITIREIEYFTSGNHNAIKSVRIGKVSVPVVDKFARLTGLVLGVPAGQTGINVTAYLSYNGVGVNGLPSDSKAQIQITRVIYTFGGGARGELSSFNSVLSPVMTLVAPFRTPPPPADVSSTGSSFSANVLSALEEAESSVCGYTMTLRMGMDNAEVKCLNEALNRRDYKAGSTTLFDESTSSALKAFQSEHYLTPDGVFGSDSQAVLVNNI